MLAATSRMYSWTTSSPARLPMFSTSTLTFKLPSGLIRLSLTCRLENPRNVVDDPPHGWRSSVYEHDDSRLASGVYLFYQVHLPAREVQGATRCRFAHHLFCFAHKYDRYIGFTCCRHGLGKGGARFA